MFVPGYSQVVNDKRPALLALTVTLVTGSILAIDAVLPLPKPLGIIAALGFLLSALAVGLIVRCRERRRSAGIRAAVRWLWDFLP